MTRIRVRGPGRTLVLAVGTVLGVPPHGRAQAPPVLPPPPLGLQLYLPVPADNPLTAEKIELGKRLFFETDLSADGSRSCASCHLPQHGFADTLSRSIGVFGRRPARHTPTVLNAGYRRHLFWDGRAESLEDQVVQPIAHPNEMGLPLDRAVDRLNGNVVYRAAFRDAFPDGVTSANVARALATYVRSLRSGNSRLDCYMANDMLALDSREKEGYQLFLGRGRCAGCHGGPLLSDGRFHNTGVGWGEGDPGRFQVTGREEDRGAFRTPSLRDVALTPPFMHDGSISTLEEVVDFYSAGGRDNPRLDPDIRPLDLTTTERRALVAFLAALTGRERCLPPGSR